MEKLLKSHWFVKIISFLLALMLYTVVAIENNTQMPVEPLREVKGNETLSSINVHALYDEEKYVLLGLPQTIDVTLDGSGSAITKMKVQRSLEVYVDLSKYEKGTYKDVPLLIRGLPEGVTAQIQDPTVDLTLDLKKTETFPVIVELLNTGDLPKGYFAEKPVTDPESVSVTGAEEVINSIAFIRGFVNVKSATETVHQRVDLKAYDSQGNLLNISLNPATIDVTVPIINPKKSLPITITQTGQLPEGLALKSITVEPGEVTVYGPRHILDNMESIRGMEVDLSTIEEDQTLELNLTLPEGILIMKPEKVIVKVDVEIIEEDTAIETRVFDNIPITILGLSDNYNASFISPSKGTLKLTVRGTSQRIDTLTQSDIIAFVNVTDLSTGEHQLKVEFNGLEELEFDQEVKEVLLNLQEKTTRS
jgi:YbbR domain-containing protein